MWSEICTNLEAETLKVRRQFDNISFSKIMAVDSPLGPINFPSMGSCPDLQ